MFAGTNTLTHSLEASTINEKADVIKLFWHQFSHNLLKARSFYSCTQYLLHYYEKIVSKYTPKQFYEIDPWGSVI
jgi:hypothetical protein